MRRWTRAMGLAMIAAGLPMAGSAQDAVIRIEAKRSAAEAATAADQWRTKFDDVVTIALPQGWTGIALGPLPRAAAEARLIELVAAGQVPADSFVSVSAVDVTPGADADADTVPAQATQADAPAEAAPGLAPDAAFPGSYLRLQSVQTRPEADTALTTWRESFPQAGLWQMPNGWFTVALGPVEAQAADAWLAAFKTYKTVPKDAFVSTADELGPVIDAGQTPELALPATVDAMPPLEDVQRALRWAGFYDGGIDGKDGPKTREAMGRDLITSRASPDLATAMQKLLDRRVAWRDSMGLTMLTDEATDLQVAAPMDRLVFDRTERALSIYGPKDGSGAALILFSQPGGQQELVDLSGLVTALGWVPKPERSVSAGHVLLRGSNDDHIGYAEGWVRDGKAVGFVLIWPAGDPRDQARVAAEMSDSLMLRPALVETPDIPDTPDADAKQSATLSADDALPRMP